VAKVISPARSDLDDALNTRLSTLCAEGWDIWDRFSSDVRQYAFHPFVAADYDAVLDALLPHRRPGLRFLEWGSATGVITIMADLLGFEAYGIELDTDLVRTARALATKSGSEARFAAGSFLPSGYSWRPSGGDGRTGTLGHGASGYLQLGHPLDDFDVIFAFPWPGEEPMMLDLMGCYGRSDARLLLNTVTEGIKTYQDGRLITPPGPNGSTGAALD
jgi:hypothetical protein